VLTEALVDSLIKETKVWREAENPMAYIAQVARNIARKEAQGDAPETGTIPLDEIIDTPAESPEHGFSVERVYSFDALKDEARRRGDLEVLAYIEGLEAGLKHPQIRAQMGWNKFDASKIRGRFHRLRDAAAEYVTRSAISDGSRTAYFETFYEGEKGRRHGEWKHKDLPPKP